MGGFENNVIFDHTLYKACGCGQWVVGWCKNARKLEEE